MKRKQKNARVETVTIETVTRVNEEHYILSFQSEHLARHAAPGQFLEIACGEGTLLRRPFAYMDVQGALVRVLFRVVGKGTEMLARIQKGEVVSIMGPLGNTFPFPKLGERTPILVGGGVGIPPLFFLAKAFAKERLDFHVFLGAGTSDNILLLNEFHRLTKNVHTATDDGSSGHHGNIVEHIRDVFPPDAFTGVVYACGPIPMLSALQTYTENAGCMGYFSMEARMGCGFGVCLGCAVDTKEGYRLCCTDGPIFPAETLVF